VLEQYGPVAVAIDSSSPKFVSYNAGNFGFSDSCIQNGSLGFNNKNF
jgi:hypothetical protein